MENMIKIDEYFNKLDSKDNDLRYKAFKELLEITEKRVSWIYDYWQRLVDKLSSDNSFQRSIGLLLLANLTLSDSENKFEDMLDDYLTFFNDEKFITSRQCLQNVWRIAVNQQVHKGRIVHALKESYTNNAHLSRSENLIKQDIIYSLNQISDFYKDEVLEAEIEELIAAETDKKLIKALQSALLRERV
ncbi:MAG TPA: hypothetical protein VHO90_00255 [Bacteroidales bacterium]|nr:hypothetical protein [Bacteroidales bacterium]